MAGRGKARHGTSPPSDEIDPAAITACRACGRPIPLPRLEALPDTNVCTPCAEDGAKPPAPPPYPQPPAGMRNCPRCGNPTIVRQSSEDRGFFPGCTSFPKCRWTQPFDERFRTGHGA